jgi:amino acid adenylation domain-containing protein
MKKTKNKEIYTLSPLQEGMLFHTLSEIGSGVDIEQIVCTLYESLDLKAFEHAWRKVIGRHGILRSGFEWEGKDEPQQYVEDSVEFFLEHVSLEEIPARLQETEIEKFIDEDRLHGFDMRNPPLMRLMVFKLSESEYRFVWTFHHILLDGRSFPLVLEEAFDFYDAFTENKELKLQQPRPYRDYIEWIRKRNLEEDEKFWRQYLSGFSSATPVDVGSYPVGSRQMGKLGATEARLSSEITAKLERFALTNGITFGTLIQACWALLLHHYSGENDIVFGVTRSGRHAPVEGIESMIGLFINTLPVRIRFFTDDSILDYLKRVRAQTLNIRQNEHSPLHKVQQWSDVPSGSPLFESLLVFENYLLDSYLRGKGGAWTRRHFLYRGRTNYPLTLLAYRDKEMLLRIEYDKDRFDQKSIDRMIGHVKTILERTIIDAGKKTAEISILTEEEKHQILVEWNNNNVDYPKNRCLHELFEMQAAAKPRNIALSYRKEHLTYKELNERANQLAHCLRKMGVGPETMVGLFMERSFEMVIGIYGILKAGGAYVPLDPEYPRDRVAFMLEDTAIPVILTQSYLADKLPDCGATVINLDSDWVNIAKQPTANLTTGVKVENLAYVIYTSGSTGKPKGVLNEHRGIVNRLLWMQDEYRLDESDRVLQKTPFSFDVSVWEFFWPLLFGARLVIAQPGGHRDSAYLVGIITNENITTLHFVPSMLQIFLEESGVEKCKSIKRLICSGEALPYELQKKCFDRLDTELHNLYGPTEAAVDVTYWRCQRESGLQIVPIGRPVANTQVYILNEYMQPLPIGASGELHIGGVQVARGYLNRPDLTAEKFVRDPFSNQLGARLYKTGDLCRYLPDGNIEYLGRNDFQVKIRGLRIEIGEIEGVLMQHPAVREAVVLARADDVVPGDKRLIAYLTGNQTAEINLDGLREFLKAKLPGYMVPSAFVQLEAFPLTGSGKVDRKALPEPKEGPRQTKEAYEAPRGRLEEVIAMIWQEVLEVEKVGVHDNFFDLGGHSLLLVRVRNKLQTYLQREILIVDLFERPTIKSLAQFLSEERKGGPSFDRIHERAMKQKETLKTRRQAFEKRGKSK